MIDVTDMTWPQANLVLNELATSDDRFAVLVRVGFRPQPPPSPEAVAAARQPGPPPTTVEAWRQRQREVLSATYASADEAHRALVGVLMEIRSEIDTETDPWFGVRLIALGLERLLMGQALVDLVREADLKRLARLAPGVTVELRRSDGVMVEFTIIGTCDTPWGPLCRLEADDGKVVYYHEAIPLGGFMEAMERRRAAGIGDRGGWPFGPRRGGRRASMPGRPS